MNKNKTKGFGTQTTDAKQAIYKKKRPELADKAGHSGITGNDSVSDSIAPDEVETKPEAIVDNTAANADSITVSGSELRALIAKEARDLATQQNKDLIAQNKAVVGDFAAQRSALETQIKLAQDNASRHEKEATRLANVFEATGHTIGSDSNGRDNRSQNYALNVNKYILPSSCEPQGAARDFIDTLNNSAYCPRRFETDRATGESYEQIDTSALDRFLRDNLQATRDGFELLFKSHGLLRGNNSRDAQPGPTLGIPGGIEKAFLEYLSAEMRMSHTARFIWRQFIDVKLELGRVPGNNILVSRFQWLDEPQNEDDFKMDSATMIANFSPEGQSLSALTVPIELFGYGLGKGNLIGNRPIVISEFVDATSMINLLNPLNSRLGQHYNAFEDMMIRRLFQKAAYNPANIYYNEAGTLTQNPATITVGEEGTCTQEALNALSSEMTRRGIPTYENGKRTGVLTTYAANQLKNDMDNKLAIVTEKELQDISNILNAGSMGDGVTPMSGYIGTYNGFMCFESTTTGVGTEGVQTTTFGAGAKTTRDSYFFGPGVVGKGISMPMEIRSDNSGTFGTSNRYVWREIAGYGTLDCCSVNAFGAPTNEQDRVMILRTVDQAI